MFDNQTTNEGHAITFGVTDEERRVELQTFWEGKKHQWEEEIRKIFTPENESPKAEIFISGGLENSRFHDVSGQQARHDDIPDEHSRYSSDFNLGRNINIPNITEFTVCLADAVDPIAHPNEARVVATPPGIGRNIWLQLSRDGAQNDGDYNARIIYTAGEDAGTVLMRAKALNSGIKVENNEISYQYNPLDLPSDE
ncbi:MAG: hypothetical protein WA152_03380 [Microgenomates group bacterium]